MIRAGVDCWMTRETAEAIGATGHRVHIIEPLKQFVVDGWTVLPFDTQHDCPGSVGFLIQEEISNRIGDPPEKLLFITDSFYCKYRFRDVDIFAVECNYSPETLSADISDAQKKRLLTSHFSLENVKRFFQANDVSQCRAIWLLHLSNDNSDEELFKREIQQITGKPVFVAGE